MPDQDFSAPEYAPLWDPHIPAKKIIKHLLLLLAAFCTITVAGMIDPFGPFPPFAEIDPAITSTPDIIAALPGAYLKQMWGVVHLLFTNFEALKYGLSFSGSLLFILISHEMGHYVVARIHKVETTLPYFIPTPPLVGAGTLGAFIKILSPLPSRKATFDIGVAGPIAGFIALIPVALIGTYNMQVITPEEAAKYSSSLYFSDPLLMRGAAWLAGIDLSLALANPFYMAAWIGLLVTSLNLIPSGQLDGGHALYAVFGAKIHSLTGVVAFVVMSVITGLGWFIYNSPSGLLFTVILAVMMKIRHPQPLDDTPLDFKRKIVAFLTLVIFALCFTPFPIQIR